MRFLLPLLVLVSGCAAARSGYVLLNAQRAVQKASDAGAEKRSPYEYTLAVEYYHKACEENTFNEFGSADALATTAIDWAGKALENTSDAEREYGEEFVPEERVEEEVKEKKENTLDQIDLDEI